MPKKTHILKDDTILKLHAFGIVSSESVFQLIVHLNSACNTALKLIKPVTIESTSDCISFAHALHDEEDSLKINLFKNKSEGQNLFKNLSTFDYLLISAGTKSDAFNQKMLSNVKAIQGISLISNVEWKKLKNYTKLFL